MILESAHGFSNLRDFVGGDACNEYIAAIALHGAHNGGDLCRLFPLTQDHLGKTLTHRPVVVYFGETEIFKWQVAQAR